jgi:hypothetical protein
MTRVALTTLLVMIRPVTIAIERIKDAILAS